MDALLNGPFGRVPLSSTPFTIGRLPDNQLVINDPKTSSRHAEIRQDADSYTLVDLGSMNGTFVNDQQLASNEPYRLNSGDAVRIGDTRFTYEATSIAPIEPTVYAERLPGSYTPTLAVPSTPAHSQDAPEALSQQSAPQSSPAAANTAYGMGMSGMGNVSDVSEPSGSKEESQQEYQHQPYVPYTPLASSTPVVPSPSSPYQGQQPQPAQPVPRHPPMYGQPTPPMYGQPQPMYGQPGYPQPPVYRQPGQFGQPGQPVPPGYPQPSVYGQSGYQMPPYGVAPTIGVPAVRPRRSRTFAIIAAIVGGLVVLAAIFAVVYFTTRSTPTKTLTTFCNDIQSGDYQGAYNQFSARVRESSSESSFESAFKTAFSTRKGLKECTVGGVNDDGSLGNGVMTWVFNDNGPSAVFKTSLIDENGTWKIDTLTQ